MRCSKGTYIRTLLEQIAEAMGQLGTMSALRRTSAGLYTEADAHTLEQILAAKAEGPQALQELALPVESAFEPLPLLVVEPWVEQHLYNGCPTSHYPAADGRYRVRSTDGGFLGLAQINGGVLKVENCLWKEAENASFPAKGNEDYADLFSADPPCPERSRRFSGGYGVF